MQIINKTTNQKQIGWYSMPISDVKPSIKTFMATFLNIWAAVFTEGIGLERKALFPTPAA